MAEEHAADGHVNDAHEPLIPAVASPTRWMMAALAIGGGLSTLLWIAIGSHHNWIVPVNMAIDGLCAVVAVATCTFFFNRDLTDAPGSLTPWTIQHVLFVIGGCCSIVWPMVNVAQSSGHPLTAAAESLAVLRNLVHTFWLTLLVSHDEIRFRVERDYAIFAFGVTVQVPLHLSWFVVAMLEFDELHGHQDGDDVVRIFFAALIVGFHLSAALTLLRCASGTWNNNGVTQDLQNRIIVMELHQDPHAPAEGNAALRTIGAAVIADHPDGVNEPSSSSVRVFAFHGLVWSSVGLSVFLLPMSVVRLQRMDAAVPWATLVAKTILTLAWCLCIHKQRTGRLQLRLSETSVPRSITMAVLAFGVFWIGTLAAILLKFKDFAVTEWDTRAEFVGSIMANSMNFIEASLSGLCLFLFACANRMVLSISVAGQAGALVGLLLLTSVQSLLHNLFYSDVTMLIPQHSRGTYFMTAMFVDFRIHSFVFAVILWKALSKGTVTEHVFVVELHPH